MPGQLSKADLIAFDDLDVWQQASAPTLSLKPATAAEGFDERKVAGQICGDKGHAVAILDAGGVNLGLKDQIKHVGGNMMSAALGLFCPRQIRLDRERCIGKTQFNKVGQQLLAQGFSALARQAGVLFPR